MKKLLVLLIETSIFAIVLVVAFNYLDLNSVSGSSSEATPVEIQEPEVFVPTSEDLERAALIWTNSEYSQSGKLGRWDQNRVEVQVKTRNGAVVSSRLQSDIEEALAWTSKATGVELALTNNTSAPFIITVDKKVSYKGKAAGGLVEVYKKNNVVIKSEVILRETGTRQVWEEIASGMGPTAEVGSKSLFSKDTSNEKGTEFDKWVLQLGYSLPTGATLEEIKKAPLN